ncbi:thiamine ABC transporter substrate-binding protein [Rhodoferax mekongensis]|uniref:Thiamine ABC transporter substrate-binding protein n=1 Tax=Rhodoferax mekongensis TaxID=3068341 RepID=A0ABZ0AXG2_9BURK|nr:thiamine ABC transporter substrate-binding protein [Rhodoferax sp. TBRC 17307]WNO04301.1 thiamine ABC transporter substrate-binding protein [Rhodoferax sp. TBRC 17307]
MQHGIFSFLKTTLGVALLTAGLSATQAQAQELRVLTHSSFTVPKPLLAQFEKENGVKLRITKAGDAGEMLNKLILTKANPIADVVYGIDNALAPKALAADVLEAGAPAAAGRKPVAELPAPLVPVDYGYVTLNYDKAWFAKNGVALPKTLDDLTQPAYAKLLVVQNPATSSPGYAFLLSTIATLGEDKAFDFWAKLRANGLKVAKGWTEAYYTEFSQNGGKHPLVVSYATSPAAELFYSKTKLAEPPTGSLSLPGAVFRQVEGVALVKGGKNRAAAEKFVDFMRSAPVQTGMQTEMWMFPAEAGVAKAEAFKFAPEPTAFSAPSDADIAAKGAEWVARWTKVVLK